MAIISEMEDLKDDPAERVDLVDYNSSDYDEFLYDEEDPQSKERHEAPPRNRTSPATRRLLRLL